MVGSKPNIGVGRQVETMRTRSLPRSTLRYQADHPEGARISSSSSLRQGIPESGRELLISDDRVASQKQCINQITPDEARGAGFEGLEYPDPKMTTSD